MADVCAEYTLGSLTINDPDGDALVINDGGDVDGLDGVALRRSVAPQGQADGAILLPAFKAYRVVTFTGVELIRSAEFEDKAAFAAASLALEAAWISALDTIENASGTLSWPGHSLTVYKGAGPKFTGPTWGKKFILSLYAPDPTIT
jgi:hypothetical protein